MNTTNEQIDIIRKELKIAGESKFLCCGTEYVLFIFSGIKKFKLTMEKFKLSSVQWNLLAKLEPKDSI
jgi:hypothetical protein